MRLISVVIMATALFGGGLPAQAEGSFCPGLIKAVAPKLAEREAVFIRSYEPAAGEGELPLGLSTTAFVYDNALAAIALVACGQVDQARIIGKALMQAATYDRTFDDGRLRNAYRAGPVGRGAALLPGWWDYARNIWGEDPAQDGTSTGNVAWAALALLTLHQATGETAYLSSARRLMDWIIAHAASGSDGFSGGFHGYDPQQVRLTWMSTEHNTDVYAVAAWLARLTSEPRYQDAARAARRLLERTFRGDHFLLGTKPDGSIAESDLLALDVQLWPWMAVPDALDWRKALGFAERNLAVDGGFDFNGNRDGVWVEGTAQAALAYRMIGNSAASQRLLTGLQADGTASGLLNATRGARLTTGLSIDPSGASKIPDFFYYKRPHLGATAWAVLAETGWNPFTGVRVP
ncbi:conserved hypothetical protein; putative signal peptide [Bradyrhizobium sp. ORS 278]|uniref:hypothetical protein n=1 Tax=Bradyrhizobium sp. (strain ORS 278) TaxID=114615 RepID=UPI0001508960|nr:hypothetical protein [Bradyrhizobium sp. ORS 278]CAL76955.1 conserved hypothetical protein; putative signal peptide [Bradyrhizobium sp. ORS 278]